MQGQLSGAVSNVLLIRGFAPIPGGQVKERLTGAIILVALMVLLVPELLTGPLRSTPRAVALAPAAGEAPLRSYTIELADEARTRSAASQASGPRQPAPLGPAAESDNAVPEVSGAGGTGDRGGAASAPVASSATTEMPPAVAPPPVAGAASAGPSSPAPSGQAAASARAARTNTMRPGSARASSTLPTAGGRENGAGASSGAWVVQLGSFASRANAEHLAQQVRSQGFEVSVSRSSSGKHLFRVRVGAAHDRAGALALAQKLRGLGHHGTVLPKQGGA